MITVYGIKTCDSVKKALKFFKEHSIEANFIDFRANPVEASVIDNWADKIEMKTLFNNRSRTYKDLGLAKENLDDTAKLAWLKKEPLLIKRPVIDHDGTISVGFNLPNLEETYLS